MRKLPTFLFLLLIMTSTSATAQTDLSETDYVAIQVTWDANPAAEQVQEYIIEYNDEGLSDNTWSTLRRTPNTWAYITFTDLIAAATRAAPKPPVTIDDELCVRLIAARDDIESDPSNPACFTMRHDSNTNEPPPTVPVISVPTRIVVDHRR